MKIFFIRNVPNKIPWSLKVFSVMFVTIFPRKTMKNSCFLDANLIVICEYIMTVQRKHMKMIEFFDEIMQKIWFKIGVGKSMKIFFIRNVSNNISWALRVFAVTSETIFPQKTMNFSCFFMFSDYCRDFYSKCMHCGIALQKHAFLVRRGARSKLL